MDIKKYNIERVDMKVYSVNNPFIAIADNLMPEEILEGLIKEVEAQEFVKAKTVSADGGSEDNYKRTNLTTDSGLNYADNPNAAFFLHAASMMINLHPSQAEPLSSIKYQLGQQYEPHHDCFGEEQLQKNRPECGNRIATALVYLSDVVEGGYTVFPHLNINIKPKKGRVLFFTNTHTGTEKALEHALHGSEPVIRGEKLAANLWFRTHVFDNELYQLTAENDAK